MHNESAYTTTSVISYEYRVQLLRVYIFTSVSKTWTPRNTNGAPQNRGLFDRKFKIVRIGRFLHFQRGHRKYARFHELSFKIYEMKIQPVF